MYANRTVSPESRETFWRSLYALNLTRIIIAGVLVAYWGVDRGQGFQHEGHRFCWYASTLYLGLSLLFAGLTLWYKRHFFPQLLTQILVDLAIISIMYVNSGGMKSGFAILYLFPLASAAILVKLVLSLFFASLVTFVLLLDSSFRLMYQEPDARLMQAAMYSSAFLAAVFVLNRLAARLISQETLAAQRGSDLQMQLAINRLAISQMDDGILVVGVDGTILTGNPAAEKMLGLSLGREPDQANARMNAFPTLQPLMEAYTDWKQHEAPEAGGSGVPAYLVIKRGELASENDQAMSAPTAHVEARFVAVRAEDLKEECTVIFLQDVTKVEQQAQQLKLASMGRLTASIAHEVRNPLASIAHASSLLAEELHEPGTARLLQIVNDNVTRMNRMIGDILNLSRRAQTQEVVDLFQFLEEIRTSFRDMHGLPEEMIRLDVEKGLRVRFDSLHLREVVVNLLSNAIRYASGNPGSIRIFAQRPARNRLELHVQDDGPSISAEVRSHLFEPFYTTSSKGTGLGLYLARELCMNNGALLDYEFHRNGLSGPATGRFVITLAPVGTL